MAKTLGAFLDEVQMETYYVIHDGEHDSWCLLKDDMKIRCSGDKRDAVKLGQSLARRGDQLIVEKENGAVENVFTYGPVTVE